MISTAPSLLPLAVYGTLRRGGGALLALEPACEYLGRGRLPGQLYDLGEFPGLLTSTTSPSTLVEVEIYQLPNAAFLATVDDYEGFQALHPQDSLFVRHEARLEEPGIAAWIYSWNGRVDGRRQIEAGDWLAELVRRRKALTRSGLKGAASP